MSPFLRRAEDVHGTIQVPTVIASEKNSTIVEEGSNERVEVDAGHVDGVADRAGLNEPLGQNDWGRWHDSALGTVSRRPTVAGRLVHDAAGALRSARCSRWYPGDVQPPVPT